MQTIRRNKPYRSKPRCGAALGLVVILMLLLSISGMTMLQIGRDARLRSISSSTDIAAYYAAEAGIERALYVMNKALEAGLWTINDLPTWTAEPLAGVNAHYTVTSSGAPAIGYTITSVGRSGTATRTVRATVKLTSPFAMNYAVLSRQDLGLKSKSTVKGFNSADLSQQNLRADIGTLSNKKGSIDIKNNVEVYGDVYVGPGGDPDVVVDTKNRSDVKGEMFTLLFEPPLDPVSAPTLPGGNQGLLSDKKKGGTLILTASDSGIYSGVEIGGQLKVEGDCVLVVAGDVSLGNSAEIVISQNGSLKMYLAGDFDAKNASGVNNESLTPSKFKLYGIGDDQEINLKNDTDFYGAVYAPNAVVTLHNGGNAYGSIIADNFELKNSGNVYYDKALQEVKITDEAIRFAVVRWEEI
ncbi:MAG TPA: hypothetical protein ENN97_08865 [Phycisphaerales bacterium]|nr:hypothetical protein [Phycisphaerales bacterium]